MLCNTCNSFPCRLGAKSDAEVCAVLPASTFPNVTLWTGARGFGGEIGICDVTEPGSVGACFCIDLPACTAVPSTP